MSYGVRRFSRNLIESRAVSRILLLLGVAAAFLLAAASPAVAFTDPPIKLALEPGNIEAAESLLLEDSPRKIPGVETTVTSVEGYEDFIAPPPEASSAAQTELESAEVPELLADSSTWTWAALPELAVAAGGFWAGWEIGSTVWGVFFGESEPKAEKVSFEANQWESHKPGELMLSDGSGNVYAPSFGFTGHRGPVREGAVTDTGYCERELFGDGERLYTPGWIPSRGCGANFQRQYVLWKPLDVIDCGAEAALCPGIEPTPYTEEYESEQPKAPTAEALRERVEKALATSKYPEFNRFFNYWVQPENYPDPRVTKKRVDEEERRCGRGTPRFENPGGNESPEPFAKKEPGELSIGTLPPGVESPAPIYLRWGETDWLPSRESYSNPVAYIDLWGGWGYRHIAAKHGWGPLDRAETEEALLTSLPRTSGRGTWIYESLDPTLGESGVSCTRRVVVDFAQKKGNPSSRGIVTSYNFVGEPEN
jgi:hypothetical protein